MNRSMTDNKSYQSHPTTGYYRLITRLTSLQVFVLNSPTEEKYFDILSSIAWEDMYVVTGQSAASKKWMENNRGEIK